MDQKVVFDPFPKQLEFIKAVLSWRFTFILFGGAIRGGKTYCGLAILITLAKLFPGTRWAVVRDSLPTLKRNTIPVFNKLCPRRFIRDFNKQEMVVTFTNGSQLIFFPENYAQDKELDRWKGLEVNGFLLEEINELQEISFYKAIERAGTYIPANGQTKPPRPIVLATCNPTRNWVKTKIHDLWEAGELPDTWKYIPSKITDNPAIMEDAAYVQQLKLMPRYQYEVYVNGNWNVQLKTGGEFYKCFEIDAHVGTAVYDPALPLHVSFDENVNPYLPALVAQLHVEKDEAGKIERKRLHIIAQIKGVHPRNTVDAVCHEIQRLFRGHRAGMFIYGDPTSKKEDTKLEKGHNFFRLIMDKLKIFNPTSRVASSSPSVKMRGDWINTWMETGLGGLSVIFDESCFDAINDMVEVKEGPNGEKVKEVWKNPVSKKSEQKNGHFSDCFDYLATQLFAAEYAEYQRGGTFKPPKIGKNLHKNRY